MSDRNYTISKYLIVNGVIVVYTREDGEIPTFKISNGIVLWYTTLAPVSNVKLSNWVLNYLKGIRYPNKIIGL